MFEKVEKKRMRCDVTMKGVEFHISQIFCSRPHCEVAREAVSLFKEGKDQTGEAGRTWGRGEEVQFFPLSYRRKDDPTRLFPVFDT